MNGLKEEVEAVGTIIKDILNQSGMAITAKIINGKAYPVIVARRNGKNYGFKILNEGAQEGAKGE